MIDDIDEITVTIETIEQLTNKELDQLIVIYQSQGKFLLFLQKLIQNEVNSTISEETLFRRNSVAMKMTTAFMKEEATDYIITLLEGTLKEMIEQDKNFEIDTSKIDENTNLEENTTHLLDISKKILEKLFSSKENLPDSLKKLFYIIRKSTENRFKSKGIQSVASLFFLRILNPSLISPLDFGFQLKENPKKNISRGLMLVTKILQNIANKAIVNKKELFMKPVEPFIEEMIEPTHQFLDEISKDVDYDFSKIIKSEILLDSLEGIYEFFKLYPLTPKIQDKVKMIRLVEKLKIVFYAPKLMNAFLKYSAKIGKQSAYLMLSSIHQFINGDDNIEVDKIISNLKKDYKIENYKMNQLEFFMKDPHKAMFDDILPELIINVKFEEFLESPEFLDEYEKKEDLLKLPIDSYPVHNSSISKVFGIFEKKHKKCVICNDRVYLIDTIAIDDKNYHKKCFKCSKCKNLLNLNNYKMQSGNLFCQEHYQEIISPRKFEALKSFKTTNPKCSLCNQVVYFKERLEVDNQIFHKDSCFKCHKCKAPLNIGNYKSFKGVIYCQIHYKDVVK